jgi:hypothetical protein
MAKDLTGFDGCRMVFKRSTGYFLEPSNIDSFSTKLRDGKIYWIRYQSDALHGSFCMVGDVIVLLDLKEP